MCSVRRVPHVGITADTAGDHNPGPRPSALVRKEQLLEATHRGPSAAPPPQALSARCGAPRAAPHPPCRLSGGRGPDLPVFTE